MGKILDYIKSNYKPTLKGFSENLIKDGLPILGLTLPECREIAKKFAVDDDLSVLNEEVKYHDEKMVKGLIIGYLKKPYSVIESLLRDFVLEIDNWAVCDSVVNTLKIFKKHQKEGIELIEYCFNNNTEFTLRFAYVLFLTYYLEEEYLDYIFEKISNEKSKEYYVQMAVAWLISYLYIKFPDRAVELFDGRLGKFTNNKSISKIRESYRVTDEQKNDVLKYRIK